jgi:4-amino-4-deoxy-L-arabinose transferase-like glycosyltransferase
MKRLTHPIILLSLCALLLLLGLGWLGLTDRDEGNNGEAAREMVETGNWISPTVNYTPHFNKPAFVYWLMATSYTLFGVSEFTARLPSALFMMGTVLLQYAFVRRWFGSTVGITSALMLLLNLEMVAIGRMALMDSVLTFFTTLAIYGVWMGLHGEGKERRLIWLFYIGMGFGTMAKGPIGFLVPAMALIPYLTLTKQWGTFRREGTPALGLLLFVAIALPWYAVMLSIHGEGYLAAAKGDTVGRFLNPIGGHGGTIFFYIPILLFGFFPWSAFLPSAVKQVYRSWRTPTQAPTNPPEPATGAETVQPVRTTDLELFCALWLIVGFLFFSFSSTRLPHYIGPLFPAAAVLAARYWHRCLLSADHPGYRLSIKVMMGLGYLFGFALAATPMLYDTFIVKIAKEFPAAHQVDAGLGPPLSGILLIIGMGFVGYFAFSNDRRAGTFWAAGATVCIALLVNLVLTIPFFSRYFIAPHQELAYIAGLNLQPDDRLILYGRPKHSLLFYAKRKGIYIKPGEEEKMKPYLAEPGKTMIVLQSNMKSKLPAEAANYEVLLERYGYTLLANKPMITPPPPGTPKHPPIPPEEMP